MEIIKNKNFGTHNTSPRSGKIEYIAIHYVGAAGDADDNVSYYNNRKVTNASADYFVGFDGSIYEYNPDPEARYCWAVGGKRQTVYGGSLLGKAINANTVSVEMCVRYKGSKVPKSPNSPNWYFTEATINSTVELTKYLMKKYNVPASRVIRHFDVNGKLCPGVVGWNAASGSEKDWIAFKARLTETTVNAGIKWYRVRKTWADVKSQLGAFKDLEKAKALADKNPGYNVYDNDGKVVYTSVKASDEPQTPVKKTIEEIAKEVIAGKWGNGTARKTALTKAGYNYSEVQDKVNELVSGKTTVKKKSVDTLAKEVIAGKWGVGNDREKRLTSAGYDYTAVQKRVNELLK